MFHSFTIANNKYYTSLITEKNLELCFIIVVIPSVAFSKVQDLFFIHVIIVCTIFENNITITSSI